MGKKHTYPDPEQFWSDKNVCITGGDGFLGSFVQKTLDERGAKNIFIPTIDEYDLTDIDNILIGDEDTDSLQNLLQMLGQSKDLMWGIATGRPIDLTIEVLEEYGIPVPDILICSVGTAIYYGKDNALDNGWQYHISYKWRPDLIQKALLKLKFLYFQEPENQRPFKVSYIMKDDPDLLHEVHEALQAEKLKYHLVFSNNQFLDILPYRASKGKAVRYLSYKWEIPLSQIMVCGESGNDADLLRGDMCALVVSNHSSELGSLKGMRKMYFSDKEYAAGIIDGLKYYNFL